MKKPLSKVISAAKTLGSLYTCKPLLAYGAMTIGALATADTAITSVKNRELGNTAISEVSRLAEISKPKALGLLGAGSAAALPFAGMATMIGFVLAEPLSWTKKERKDVGLPL